MNKADALMALQEVNREYWRAWQRDDDDHQEWFALSERRKLFMLMAHDAGAKYNEIGECIGLSGGAVAKHVKKLKGICPHCGQPLPKRKK